MLMFIAHIIEFLFWLVIGFSFLHTFLTHFILWVELRLLSLQPDSKSTIPWQALAKSFVIEFLCLIVYCITFPFRYWEFQTKIPATDIKAPPILLIHGYLHHQVAWFWFIRLLRKKQPVGPIYMINLFPAFSSIAKLAEQVKEKVEAIQSETDASQVILIGHSMGGLVASYFCEYLAKPKQVARIITLGSPFKGTWSAALAYGQNGREMAPQSPFLVELLDKIHHTAVPYFSVASKIDNLVIPWQSALINEDIPNHNLIFEDYGHLRLLFSPVVVNQIVEWIAEL